MLNIIKFALIMTLLNSCEKPVFLGADDNSDSDDVATTTTPTTPVISFTDPSGDLDTSYATSGSYKVPTAGFTIAHIAIQSTGKLILFGADASNFYTRRLNTDGSLDTSYGSAGLSTIATTDGKSKELKIDTNDNIVMAGTAEVHRLNSSGVVDASFGTAGKYITTGISIQSLEIDSSGNIWVNGFTGTTNLLKKLTSSGAFVATYSTIPGVSAQTYGSAIDSNNNIYQVGIVSDGAIKGLIAKIKPDGTLDTSFGTAGTGAGWTSFTTTGGYADTKSVTVLADGDIVVAGVLATSKDLFMTKLSSTGVIDTSFGTSGYITPGFSGTVFSPWSQGYKIEQLENGDIIVAGNNADDAVITKYDLNGNIDTGFGTAGIFSFDVNGGSDHATTFAVNADGTIILSGYSDDALYLAKLR